MLHENAEDHVVALIGNPVAEDSYEERRVSTYKRNHGSNDFHDVREPALAKYLFLCEPFSYCEVSQTKELNVGMVSVESLCRCVSCVLPNFVSMRRLGHGGS